LPALNSFKLKTFTTKKINQAGMAPTGDGAFSKFLPWDSCWGSQISHSGLVITLWNWILIH